MWLVLTVLIMLASVNGLLKHRRVSINSKFSLVNRNLSLKSNSVASDPKLKQSYKLAILRGDGIGPEIIRATLPVLQTISSKFNIGLSLDYAEIGGAAVDEYNNPFPESTFMTCKNSDAVLLACVGGYKWDTNEKERRPEFGLLQLRSKLELFANLRPIHVIPELVNISPLKPHIVKGVDMMIVRELTGGLYFGEPRGTMIGSGYGNRRAYNTATYTEHEITRIAKVAFDIAVTRNKKKSVCSVDKANVLEVSQLWRQVTSNVHKISYEGSVQLNHMYIDNCAMQIVKNPSQFDVILCSNMFGDILSDEAAMLVGSLGMLPSASLCSSSKLGVYEPCHGSAPDLAGQDVANPIGQILSAAMMFRYSLDQSQAADTIEKAVEITLRKGFRTKDIFEDGYTLVGCQRMGEEIARTIETM